MNNMIWSQQELIESTECVAPRGSCGWASTDLTDAELQECYRLMHQDYEDLQDPYSQIK